MTTTPKHLKNDSPHGVRRGPAPRAAAAILTVAVPLALVSLTSSGASASTGLPPVPAGFVSTATPASGVFTVTGRAWGHRIGLSQVGAQYAGRTGVSTAAILAHYYPSSVLTTVDRSRWTTLWPGTASSAAAPVLRVRLEGNSAPTLTVTATSGLALWVGGRAVSLPRPPAATPAPARWRLAAATVARPGSGLYLQYSTAPTGTRWTTIGPVIRLGSGFVATRSSSGVRVELPNGTTRTEPSMVVLTSDHPGSTRWTTVSYVDLETYVGVVTAAEIGPSSAPATLGAQAIAARTYATRLSTINGPTHSWDICSTTCEYYAGTATGTVAGGVAGDRSRVYASSTAAAAATVHQILTYGGTPILSMFAAANGGYTVSGRAPYLPSRPDPWDSASGSSSSSWPATLPASALTPLLPAGDRLTSIAVGGRDGHGDLGGAPSAVLLDSVSPSGVPHRTATTPAAIRARWAWPTVPTGLRSTWFALSGDVPVAAPPAAPTPTPAVAAPVAAPAVVAAPTVLLRRGNRGRSVVTVQRLLHVSPTGYYGPLTTAAVAAWQRAHHLPATGAVDTVTWIALTRPRATASAGVPAASPRVLTGRLGWHSTGPAVATVQRALATLYPAVRVTSVYDPATRLALGAYQRSHPWAWTRDGSRPGVVGRYLYASLLTKYPR